MSPAERVYDYINKLERIEKRESIVDKFNLNHRWEREFIKTYGTTIYRTVKIVVIARAKKLIESGYLIKDMAAMTGYKSELTFCMSYKSEYGYRPTHEPKVKDIKWLTLEPPDGTHILRQHAFVRAERKRPFSLEYYPGNRMLCNAKSGASNEDEEYEAWADLEAEEITANPCAWCLEIYNSLRKE